MQNERPPMVEPLIRFEDGAGYERMMGKWSRLAGEIFLDWLAPASGLRWIDVGCGNGAFTELLAERCAPAEIQGVDPSEAQLAFARARHSAGIARFQKGDAMALPFADNSFDAAVMALVIFFVPDPAAGVAEMARVVRTSGEAFPSYAWAMSGPADENFRRAGAGTNSAPFQDFFADKAAEGSAASRMENLRVRWTSAPGCGAQDETRDITVQRTVADFDENFRER